MAVPVGLKAPKIVILLVADEQLSYHGDNSSGFSKGSYQHGVFSPDVSPGHLDGAALLKGWVVECPLQPQLSLKKFRTVSVYELAFFMQRKGSDLLFF